MALLPASAFGQDAARKADKEFFDNKIRPVLVAHCYSCHATEKPKGDSGPDGPSKGGKLTVAEASMFYVAYFKQGAPVESRPITFLYNGGPGSSSVWLHMGAFGPRRVVTQSAASSGPAGR